MDEEMAAAVNDLRRLLVKLGLNDDARGRILDAVVTVCKAVINDYARGVQRVIDKTLGRGL